MIKYRTYETNFSLKQVLKQTFNSFFHKFYVCNGKKFIIAYVESYITERDKFESLPADTEFLTL